MSVVDGQQTMDGQEVVDRRVENAARALWWRDARRTWGQDGQQVAREQARKVWPTVRGHYVEAARDALAAADRA